LPLAQVLPHPQLIFPSKTWSLEFIWIFSGRNHLKSNISHIPNPKSYQINSIKSCSSRSFQQHQRHIPFSPKFSATIYLIFSEEKAFNIQELFHHKSNAMDQAHAPLLIKSFPKTPRTRSKHPGSVDLITTKQNKLPSFLDRCFSFQFQDVVKVVRTI
jgi:hypothetical protein